MKTSRLTPAARALLTQLQRGDLDYSHIDERAYRELRAAGLATVVFGSTGNWCFATSAGRRA